MIDPLTPRWSPAELTYCANVHPGETVDEVLRTLEGSIGRVRELRGLAGMGTGLWLSRSAADELRRSAPQRRRFVDCLDRSGLRLFTLNGFPYGGFHSVSVKQRVYRPNWTEPARYEYTLDLARLLAECLPAHSREGTISTVPLGYRFDWSEDHTRRAAENLYRLAADLERLRQKTGRRVRVCLEMEPDGALESTDEAIRFFADDLPSAARRLGLPSSLMDNHLGICFDICHQSVMFEDVRESLAKLVGAGIGIGKIQISSALEVSNPADPSVLDNLAEFSEPRYLHQVRTRTAAGRLAGVPDLNLPLDSAALPADGPWRIHFHVPIDAPELKDSAIGTTRREIVRTLEFLADNPAVRPHMEVETYTWSVMPEALRPRSHDDLLENIARELRWLEIQMSAQGLLRPAAESGPSQETRSVPKPEPDTL